MQTKSALAAKEKFEKTRAEDSERISKQTRQREEQLAKLLQETETRHSKFLCLFFCLFSISLNSSSLLCFYLINCLFH